MENEDFIVWMTPSYASTFQKPWKILNVNYQTIKNGKDNMSTKNYFDGLPNGMYKIVIENRWNIPKKIKYQPLYRKKIVITTSNWAGGKHNFLGLAYIVPTFNPPPRPTKPCYPSGVGKVTSVAKAFCESIMTYAMTKEISSQLITVVEHSDKMIAILDSLANLINDQDVNNNENSKNLLEDADTFLDVLKRVDKIPSIPAIELHDSQLLSIAKNNSNFDSMIDTIINAMDAKKNETLRNSSIHEIDTHSNPKSNHVQFPEIMEIDDEDDSEIEIVDTVNARAQKSLPENIVDEFHDLSDEAEALCKRVWGQGPETELFKHDALLPLTRQDLKTLAGESWLNDTIIESYMSLIVERSKNDSTLPKVYAFNTNFYLNISNPSKGFASVKRWTKKVDIFSHEILLIPINIGSVHWTLAVVDFRAKIINFYDSMNEQGEYIEITEKILDYLVKESVEKRKFCVNPIEWELVSCKDIPQQNNNSDCGVFACKFADYSSRRAEFNFNCFNMPYFRQRMVYQLCQSNLAAF